MTLVWGFCAGASALAAAAALVHLPYAAPAGLLALLAGTILLQTRGPRVVNVTLVAFISYYLGMFLHPSAAGLGWMMGLLVPALAACVLFLRLLPDDPAATARRVLRSVTRQARRVLAEAARPGRRASRLERHLTQLNQAAVMAEEYLQLANVPAHDAMRASLVNLEVAVTHAALSVDAAETKGGDAHWQTALTELAHATAALGPGSVARATAAPPARPPLAWASCDSGKLRRADRDADRPSAVARALVLGGYRPSS